MMTSIPEPPYDAYRFDQPWAWRQRFSMDELKEIYFKLFGYDWFHEMKGVFTFEHPYEIGRCRQHGYVKLEDGGRTRLEYIEPARLDWFLYNGYEFGFDKNCRFDAVGRNPLYHKLSREEALVTLDVSSFEWQ